MCRHGIACASNAAKLTANHHIQARIDELVAKAAAKAGVTVERIVAELDKIALSDIRKARTDEGPVQCVTLKDSQDVDDDTAATVSEVWQISLGIRFKFHDKLGAIQWRATGLRKSAQLSPQGI